VLCEKPLALSVEDAREMWQKAEAVGVKHFVLFTWRWQPHFRYLKQLVSEGYIGRCYQAQFRFMAGFARQPRYTWRVDGQRANGVVSDLGAHMIDFARWYVGEIAAVSAHLSSFVAHPAAGDQPLVRNNDAALVTLQYENGAQGIIQVSVLAHQELTLEVVLHGEAGTLEARHVFSGEDAGIALRGRRHDESKLSDLAIPAALLPAPNADSLLAPYLSQPSGPRLFIDSIIENRLASPNFYDGYRVQQVINAALDSHQSRSWQYLD
jgi:predicted dehydrogenase